MSLASGVCTRGVVLMAALLAAFSPARANDAAHKMAEKFANEAKKSEETDAQRKAAADARKKETERLAQEKMRWIVDGQIADHGRYRRIADTVQGLEKVVPA